MTTSHTSTSSPRRTALITGASSGIGRDLAMVFARHGHDLFLVARTREALERVADECASQHGVRAEVIVADLADPQSPQRLAEEIARRSVVIDILVNNAGFGVHGRFSQADPRTTLDLLQVNITALTHLTRLFLPGMLERRWGRILNVASTAAFVPGPFLNVYYASKAYVLSHSVALARELRRTGVTVTALCPGPTTTDFQRRAGMDKARLFRVGTMASPPVAEAGYRGMMKGRAMVVPGWFNKFTALGSRLLPRTAIASITAKLNREKW